MLWKKYINFEFPSSQILRDEKSTLNDVLQAVHELGLSHKYFQHLAVEGDRMKYDLARAAIEAKQCQDLLSQVWNKKILILGLVRK